MASTTRSAGRTPSEVSTEVSVKPSAFVPRCNCTPLRASSAWTCCAISGSSGPITWSAASSRVTCHSRWRSASTISMPM